MSNMYSGSLRIYQDVYPKDFNPDYCAVDNWNSIVESQKMPEFWDFLRIEFPNGCSVEELNSFIADEWEYYSPRVGIYEKADKEKACDFLNRIGLEYIEEYYDCGYYVIRFRNVDFDLSLYDSEYMSVEGDEIVFNSWQDALSFALSLNLSIA